jgi:hypothetical protein
MRSTVQNTMSSSGSFTFEGRRPRLFWCSMIAASSTLMSNVPRIVLPAVKDPWSFTPNQRPNSSASVIARHTRETGARSVTRFSILFCDSMCNLLVAV